MAKKLSFPREEAIKIIEEIVETAKSELHSTGERIIARNFKKSGELRAPASREKVKTEKLARAIQKHEMTVDERTLKASEENYIRAAEKIIKDSDGVIPPGRMHELLIFLSAGALTEFTVDTVATFMEGDLVLKAQDTGAEKDSHIQIKGSDGRIHIDFTEKGVERELLREFDRQFKSGASASDIGVSSEQIQRFAAVLTDKGLLWDKAIDAQAKRGKIEEFLKMVPESTAADFFLFGFSNAKSENITGGYTSSFAKAGAYNLSVPTKDLVEMYRSKPSQFSMTTAGSGENKRLEVRFHGRETSMKQVFNSYADNPYIGMHHAVPKVFFRNRVKSKIDTYNRNIRSNHFGFIHSNVFGDYRKGK